MEAKRRLKTINGGGGGPYSSLTDEPTAKRRRTNASPLTTTSDDPELVDDGALEEQSPRSGRLRSHKGHVREMWSVNQKASTRLRTRGSPGSSLAGLSKPHDLRPRRPSDAIDITSPPTSNSDLAQGFEIQSPPPANITSDIRRTRGRTQKEGQAAKNSASKQTTASHHAELVLSDSEDELQQDDAATRRPPKKPRASLNEARVKTAAQKGIEADDRLRRIVTRMREQPEQPASDSGAFRLRRAASGGFAYDAALNGPIDMLLGESVLKPLNADGSASSLRWLHCNLDRVSRIFHNATNSRFLITQRSVSYATPGQGRLFLEFDDKKGPVYICENVDLVQCEELESQHLEKMFEHSFKQANTPRWQNGRTPESMVPEEDDPLPLDRSPRKATPQAHSTGERRRLRLLYQVGSTARSTDPALEHDVTTYKVRNRPVRTREPVFEISEEIVDTENHRGNAHDPRHRRRSQSPIRSKSVPIRWSKVNPGWEKRWPRSLVYPPNGRNRATVDQADIARLDEGEFLNDNLINFYICYLQTKLAKERPELLKRIHFFSTFFLEKLRSTKGQINYDGVKTWTARVDLFTYDYVVVPVNENAHWYLAIVVNTPVMVTGLPQDDEPVELDVVDVDARQSVEDVLPTKSSRGEPRRETRSTPGVSPYFQPTTGSSPASIVSSRATGNSPMVTRTAKVIKPSPGPRNDPRSPRIITLDSLGSTHSPMTRAIREYMKEEALNKKGIELEIEPLGLNAKGIPQQDNYCDCGVYILGYMDEFLKDPDGVAKELVAREKLNWSIKPRELRSSLRDLLFDLQDQQEEGQEQVRSAKKLRRQERSPLLGGAATPDSMVCKVTTPVDTTPTPMPRGEAVFSQTDFAVRETSSPAGSKPSSGPQTPLDGLVASKPSSAPQTPVDATEGARCERLASTPTRDHQVAKLEVVPQTSEHRSTAPGSPQQEVTGEVAAITVFHTPVEESQESDLAIVPPIPEPTLPRDMSTEEDAASHVEEVMPRLSSEPRFIAPLSDSSPERISRDEMEIDNDDVQEWVPVSGAKGSPNSQSVAAPAPGLKNDDSQASIQITAVRRSPNAKTVAAAHEVEPDVQQDVEMEVERDTQPAVDTAAEHDVHDTVEMEVDPQVVDMTGDQPGDGRYHGVRGVVDLS